MARTIRFAGAIVIAALCALMLHAPQAMAQSKLCFGEVPDCIEGRFAEYWQQNGGLPVFGYPISPASLQNVGGGQFLVQTFERNRFELHPENARPYDVLLGRLGDLRLTQTGHPWEGEPKAATNSQGGCQFFGATVHLVCEPFLSYWKSHGLNIDGKSGYSETESLALFGLPLTEARQETGSDGKQYLTQWFERARFELHPEVGANAVLLGLLGRETAGGSTGGAPAPTPPPADPCAGVPDPVNARIRPSKCFNAGTQAAADMFGFKANEQVGFWFNTPDGKIFGTVRTYNIGPTGGVNDFPLDTTGLTPGIWSFVMEGTSSGNKAIVYFKILGTEAAPPSSTCEGVPPPVSGSINPVCVRPGDTISAQGTGFQANERIGFYATAPDQSVVELQLVDGAATADGSGNFGITFRLGSGVGRGIYAITFEGVKSGHKAIVYFRVQ